MCGKRENWPILASLGWSKEENWPILASLGWVKEENWPILASLGGVEGREKVHSSLPRVGEEGIPPCIASRPTMGVPSPCIYASLPPSWVHQLRVGDTSGPVCTPSGLRKVQF